MVISGHILTGNDCINKVCIKLAALARDPIQPTLVRLMSYLKKMLSLLKSSWFVHGLVSALKQQPPHLSA